MAVGRTAGGGRFAVRGRLGQFPAGRREHGGATAPPRERPRMGRRWRPAGRRCAGVCGGLGRGHRQKHYKLFIPKPLRRSWADVFSCENRTESAHRAGGVGAGQRAGKRRGRGEPDSDRFATLISRHWGNRGRATGSEFRAPGPRPPTPGSWLLAPSSEFRATGSDFPAPDSWQRSGPRGQTPARAEWLAMSERGPSPFESNGLP